MLHHYNTYTSTLSRFLTGYHHQQQLEDHQNNEDNENPLSGLCEDSSATEEEPRCRSNSSATSKSFTIAAILGLNTNSEHGNICNSSADLSVMNLTVHSAAAADRSTLVNCGRFPHHQLPVNNRPLMPSSTGHFSVSHHHGIISPSSSAKANARNVKNNISSNILQSKKSCKSKRVRTIFTPEQLERLEAEFERQQYMVGPERLYLAHTLQLTEAQVKVWFQNRRIKWRKHHLELTHQRLAVLKQQQLLIDDSSSAIQNPDIIHDNNSSDPEN